MSIAIQTVSLRGNGLTTEAISGKRKDESLLPTVVTCLPRASREDPSVRGECHCEWHIHLLICGIESEAPSNQQLQLSQV
jgi:hypothetical protein